MLRDAIKEVRQHPGRFVATLVAIAISVGFMAATSVFLNTEKVGLAKSLNRQIAAADAVIDLSPQEGTTSSDVNPATVLKQARATDGVAAAEPLYQTSASASANDVTSYLTIMNVPSEQFRWAKVIDGQWPTGNDQIVLSEAGAKKFKVKVGDKLDLSGTSLTVVGITNDPKSIFFLPAYVSTSVFEGNTQEVTSTSIEVKAKPGVSPDQVVQNLRATIKEGTITTAAESQQKALDQLTKDVDQMQVMLNVFAAIAVVVGMIIIANTFTILITQRRRQIGLLRAVGASTGQVRGRFLAEAAIIGVVGSLLGVALGVGVAAAGSALTGSLYWGLALPWTDLLVALVIGVVVTVVAAIAPVWRTSSVKPLEALQPVLSADAQKKVSLVRAIICGILGLIGVLLAVASLVTAKNNLLFALGSAGFITLAVLGGAPLYVAWLIKGFGKLIGRSGPTARLATMNAARNPARAASTAVALMLAVGLIVTLQVGGATVKESFNKMLAERYPVDVAVTSFGTEGMDASVVQKVTSVPGVSASLVLKQATVTLDSVPYTVRGLAPDASTIAPSLPAQIPTDVAYVAPNSGMGKTITIGSTTLKVVENHAAGESYHMVYVAQSTLDKISPKQVDGEVWLKLKNRDDFASTMQKLAPIAQSAQLSIGGGATFAYIINQVVNVMLAITTALLGVAVAIALVGVANTLALSVIERTRETGLLRALGMKRGKLRVMLLVEAITLALVGVVVGVVAGAFFAWMGLRAVFKQFDIPASDMHFAIDWVNTLVLLAVALVAATLASILPGRRASRVAPTEALAVE